MKAAMFVAVCLASASLAQAAQKPGARETRPKPAAGAAIADAYDQFLLAHHYETDDKIDLAIAAYKRAMALDPTAADVPAELAGLYLRQNKAPEAMAAAENNRAPNVLCEYAFELAQKFSRFYSEHHILSENDGAVRASRLGLCETTLATLTKVLDVLGIEVPERM